MILSLPPSPPKFKPESRSQSNAKKERKSFSGPLLDSFGNQSLAATTTTRSSQSISSDTKKGKEKASVDVVHRVVYTIIQKQRQFSVPIYPSIHYPFIHLTALGRRFDFIFVFESKLDNILFFFVFLFSFFFFGIQFQYRSFDFQDTKKGLE